MRSSPCDDDGNRVNGRKRHILVDRLGRPAAFGARGVRARRTCAGVAFCDRAGAHLRVDPVAADAPPKLGVVWDGHGYTGALAAWRRGTRGWRVEAVRHPARRLWRYGSEERPAHTVRVLPRRWIVARTFARLGQPRRLSREYERLPEPGEAVTYGAGGAASCSGRWRGLRAVNSAKGATLLRSSHSECPRTM